MARRLFELPGIQDLSKEQEMVRALPKKGQFLVIGGPGTGKSVLALLRARRHANAKEPHAFLVFNKLLHEASRHLGGKEILCLQWMAWFFSIFRQIICQPVPRMAAEDESSWQEIDWPKTKQIVQEQNQLPERPEYLIIDEGQDMPPDFYQALIALGFENIFVVADQNQQIISGQNSSRKQIQIELGIDPSKVVELKKNFRNSAAIARLAREFHTGDPATPLVQIPETSSTPCLLPILFTYSKSQFNSVIERILKMADREPTKLIGVIAPNNFIRNDFFDALTGSTGMIAFDNPPPLIRTYHKASKDPVNFHQGGIIVINAQACKGLEFDYVFLADIDVYPYNIVHHDALKRLFYVMVARARNNLTLLRSAGSSSPVNRILPQNPTVLKYYP